MSSKIPITKIFKVLDSSGDTGTLKQRLDDIDSKISEVPWYNIVQSACHTFSTSGFSTSGYELKDKMPPPLDWRKVRELRNEAVTAAESRFGGTVEAEGGTQENDDDLTL